MLLWILRGCFAIIILGMAVSALSYFRRADAATAAGDLAAFAAIVGLGLITVVLDLSVKQKEISTISAIFFGVLLGLLLGTLFWAALEPLLTGMNAPPQAVQMLRLFLVVVCCYSSVSTLLQTKDDFRF